MAIFRNEMLIVVIAAIFVFAYEDVLGNAVTELSLEQKVHHSDVVVIGQVESLTPNSAGGEDDYAIVRVASILKGSPEGRIDAIYGGQIAEQNPMCCTQGHSSFCNALITGGIVQ